MQKQNQKDRSGNLTTAGLRTHASTLTAAFTDVEDVPEEMRLSMSRQAAFTAVVLASCLPYGRRD